MFYCLQALVVPSESNRGFNAKQEERGRDEEEGMEEVERKESQGTPVPTLVIFAVPVAEFVSKGRKGGKLISLSAGLKQRY